MASMSDFLENALIEHILLNNPYVSPSPIYLALYTSDPTDANVGTEVSTIGTAYTRVPVVFTNLGNGVATVAVNIAFPTAIANWGTISHVGITDAISGPNLLFHGPLATPRTILTGDSFIILAGQLQVSIG